jgi:hypothetical protein
MQTVSIGHSIALPKLCARGFLEVELTTGSLEGGLMK